MRRATPSSSFLVVLTLTFLASPSYVLAQVPQLSGISPTSVLPGTQVTFTGSGLGATQGANVAERCGSNKNSCLLQCSGWPRPALFLSLPVVESGGRILFRIVRTRKGGER